VIILITAAGGAFGHVLRQSGIASEIQQQLPVVRLGILPLAFAITAIVRIAQGSATVAMITAVGIVAPWASTGESGFHPVYLALAIGCGSKPISWMNDSGFWIVSQMSGLTPAETLKTHSAALTLMGVAGLIVTMAAAYMWPLL
jgi:GntP family gluconate:H+ symporter